MGIFKRKYKRKEIEKIYNKLMKKLHLSPKNSKDEIFDSIKRYYKQKRIRWLKFLMPFHYVLSLFVLYEIEFKIYVFVFTGYLDMFLLIANLFIFGLNAYCFITYKKEKKKLVAEMI